MAAAAETGLCAVMFSDEPFYPGGFIARVRVHCGKGASKKSIYLANNVS